jgi:hypothetical protein
MRFFLSRSVSFFTSYTEPLRHPLPNGEYCVQWVKPVKTPSASANSFTGLFQAKAKKLKITLRYVRTLLCEKALP